MEQNTQNPTNLESNTVKHEILPSNSLTSKQVLAKLREKSVTFKKNLPLEIGIDKQVFELFPEVSKKLIRTTLRLHTNSIAYLKEVANGAKRYNLLGEPVVDIEQEHKDFALAKIKQRLAEVSQKKREEQKQKYLQEKQQAKEKQKNEKLQQLVQRFTKD